MIHFRGRAILLDIEGTTASIAFVHEVMFPFARRHLDAFLQSHWSEAGTQKACLQLAQEAGQSDLASWSQATGKPELELVISQVHSLMDRDVKSTGLKALQGMIWEAGFDSGELVAPLFDDVLPALQRWLDLGIELRIYSSGSIAAQKLFFGHTQHGDLLPLFSGHFDTNIGSKREAGSYTRIAEQFGLSPAEILFVSDLEAELEAADTAGMKVGLARRPGNGPLLQPGRFPEVTSFEQIAAENSAARKA